MKLVVAESKADFVSTTFDMQMFMATRVWERMLTEWRKIFTQAGWLFEEVVRLKSQGKILVLKPKN